jgi:hypothetical protein
MSSRPKSLFSSDNCGRRSFSALSAVLFFALAGVAGFAGLVMPSSPAFAQTATTRTVSGKVEDKSGTPIKGAIVYLKDSHTLAVKSAVTIDDGTYRFGQLAQNTDYEIWAANGSQKSGTKNISSFDNRKEFDITLKIDK